MTEGVISQLHRSGMAGQGYRAKSLPGHLARMGAARLRDALLRPQPRQRGDVPYRVDAITRAWLTDVLCHDRPGVRVSDFALSGRSSGSTVRARIEVEYEGQVVPGDLPVSLFAKTSPSFINRFMLGFMDTPRTEAMFYEDLRPRLSVEAPIGYFGDYDAATGRSIQLLEDLVATKGAQFCTPMSEIDRPRAEEVVRLLAIVHSQWYGRTDLHTAYPWLMTYRQFFEGGHVRFGLEKYHDRSLTRIADMVPPDIRARSGEIWNAKVAVLRDHEDLPQTVLHGDVHLGNWYMTGAGHMGLCDWQCIVSGTYAQDLAYAITTTLRSEHRRAWERDLIGIYVDTFNRLAARPISYEDCWHLYRRHAMAGLLMWTVTLTHGPLMPDMQPEETSLELLRRAAVAMSDLGTLDLV